MFLIYLVSICRVVMSDHKDLRYVMAKECKISLEMRAKRGGRAGPELLV